MAYVIYQPGVTEYIFSGLIFQQDPSWINHSYFIMAILILDVDMDLSYLSLIFTRTIALFYFFLSFVITW